MRLYVNIEDREDIKEIYGIIEYMDGTLKKHDKLMVIKNCDDYISRQYVLDVIKAQDELDGNDAVVWIEKYVKEAEPVKPGITTNTIMKYCKDHNLVLCDRGTEYTDCISRKAALEVLTGGEIKKIHPKINEALENIINALPCVNPVKEDNR